MRGGIEERWFASLLDATACVKTTPENRCPILYAPGIENWLAFVRLGEGFARYPYKDMPLEQALVRSATA
jgi:hypothetical protein